jgi:hypothetical protein
MTMRYEDELAVAVVFVLAPLVQREGKKKGDAIEMVVFGLRINLRKTSVLLNSTQPTTCHSGFFLSIRATNGKEVMMVAWNAVTITPLLYRSGRWIYYLAEATGIQPPPSVSPQTQEVHRTLARASPRLGVKPRS